MNQLQKVRKPFIVKWVSFYSFKNNFSSSRTILCPADSGYISQDLRFYGTKGAEECETKEKASKVTDATRREAQAALLEYFYSTRSLQFMDAENMSKNSPHFLGKLLRKVDKNGGIGRSLTRFLRYHPINEFEPFFESMGLEPSEYCSFLPRELIFLNDDPLLMESYHALCNYGVSRNKIGKIYRGAPEVFRLGNAVLHSKLKSLEDAGLKQTVVIELVILSPNILVGDVRKDFFNIVEKLRSCGIGYDWIEAHLLEEEPYNWSSILDLLCLLSNICYSEDQLGRLIRQHPELLFATSGHITFSLIVFLMKFGYTPNEICTLFMQFPRIQLEKFIANLRHSYEFLIEIEMPVPDIQSIVCSNVLLLGSCSLKRASSLRVNLAVGKKRLCKIIKENPLVLKNWVLGNRVKRLPVSEEEIQSQMMKTKFLSDLGFVENSKEMKRALKAYRGKGLELQQRYDCLVNAGFDPKDVSRMVKICPQILSQSKEVIETKIDYLVNDFGYTLSDLRKFPACIKYNVQRVNLRLSMYKWLKEVGAAEQGLALSTLLACPERTFMRTYVKSHPRGPEVWESLKQKLSV